MRWARQRPPGRICAATYPRRLQDENGGQRGGLRLRGERYRKLCVASNFGPQPPFFKGNNEKCPYFFIFLRKKSKTDIVFLKRNRNLTYLINRAVANCLVRGLKINTKGEFYYGI